MQCINQCTYIDSTDNEYDASPQRKRNATLNAWIDSISISALRLRRWLASYSEPALRVDGLCS